MWKSRLFLLFALLIFPAADAFAGVGGPAGILLYHRDGEEIYLLLADHTAPSKRGWAGFGGSHDKNETPAQTAARETEEETRGFFKRGDLLAKIKDQTPFEDGAFSLFFAEIDPVSPGKIAAHPIPKNKKAYRERGPWAWVPLSEVMKHLKEEPSPNTVALLDDRLRPDNAGSKHFWPVWLSNMYRALNAGALPWMKPPTAEKKEPVAAALSGE